MSFRKRIALQRRKKKNLQSNISSDEKPLLARKKRSGGIVNKPKDFRDAFGSVERQIEGGI